MPTEGQADSVMHLDNRVSSVERNVETLRDAHVQTQNILGRLSSESSNHTTDLHDIKTALQSQAHDSKTDWTAIGTLIGVTIVIFGLAFAPVYRDLNKLESQVSVHHEEQKSTIVALAKAEARIEWLGNTQKHIHSDVAKIREK